MTVRTAPRHEGPAAGSSLADVALDDALARIRDLTGRLWEVRRVHQPVAVRSLRGGRVRCAACGQACPCPTLRAADAA